MNKLFQIKICGITTPTDAWMACQNGADAVGLNFYVKSLRFINSNDAEAACFQVDLFNATSTKKVWKVGVFVDPTGPKLLEMVGKNGLDAVQFHGNETIEFFNWIRKPILELQPNCKMIRAVRARILPDSGDASQKNSELARVQSVIKLWESVGIDAILLDATSAGEFGGTGQALDWQCLRALNFTVPFILAGGLNSDNVSNAIRMSHANGVDVASGVESAPGRKDKEKVETFARNTGWL